MNGKLYSNNSSIVEMILNFNERKGERKMKGSLNNHTEHSLNQSTLSVKQLVEKAKEMGMTSLALTNLDNVLATGQFLGMADDSINLIPGVTLRVNEMNSQIILLAKNIDGYNAISRLITEANHPSRIIIDKVSQNKVFSYPIADMDLLKKYANNNIFALTGGKNGILAHILLKNVEIQKKLAPYANSERNLFIKQNGLKTLLDKIAAINKPLTEAKSIVKKQNKTIEELNEKVKAGNSLTEEEQTIAKQYMAAKSNVETLSLQLESLKEQQKNYQKAVSEEQVNVEKKNALQSQLIPDEQIWQECVNTAIELQSIYGQNLFIEVENHLMDNEEKWVMRQLTRLAIQLRIPLVATNDVYMLDNSPLSIMSRQVIRYNGTEEYTELTQAEKRQYLLPENELVVAMEDLFGGNKSLVQSAINNIDYIASQCHVTIDNSEYHAPKFACADAKAELRRICMEGMQKRYALRTDYPELLKKLEYELSVIDKMGFNDYILIVQDFLRIGRRAGTMSYAHIDELKRNMGGMTLKAMLAYIEAHEGEAPGEAIGPGRGSAAGSIVCYTTGITNIDPSRYGLMFERFLNPERVSMPDIDSDFSYESRDICIEYCKKLYGENAVASINTESTASVKADINLVARALAARDCIGLTQSEKEVIKKQYGKKAAQLNALVPFGPTIKLKDCKETMREKYHDDAMCMEILDIAEHMEGCITNFGTHAAGIIIGDKDLSAYIAKMWDFKNLVYKVQADMTESEGLYKLLKMDFLGLRTLSIITKAVRIINDTTGVYIDIDGIPFEEEIFKNLYCKLRTNDVFQCESNFMKGVIKEIQPANIDELILTIAIGRPGPIDFLPKIVAVKNGLEKPNYLIPEMAEILDETYGSPVYQEQIMKLMQLAGMTAGEADTVRRYMSKKKTEKFESFKPKFVEGMVARGANRDASETYWLSLVDFSKYAFNKSHAAIYAIVSYQTAWLKYHYPAEMICACMQYNENPDKLSNIISDAWDFNVPLIGPDVNNMQPDFICVQENNTLGIQFGLTSVKGCGDALISTVNPGEKFESFADFVFKKRYGKGVLEALIYAGAFDCFNKNRKMLTVHAAYLNKKLEDIKKVEKTISTDVAIKQILHVKSAELKAAGENWKKIFEAENISLKVKNLPKVDSVTNKIEKNMQKLNELKRDFFSFAPSVEKDDPRFNLAKEKEVLGLYISGHPTDYYEKPEYALQINKLTANKQIETGTFGIISNLQIKNKKADGKPMAFFTLEDNSGSIDVKCFTNSYEEYGHLLKEGEVIALKGKCTEDNKSSSSSEDGETEIQLQFIVKEIELCKEKTVLDKNQDNSALHFHFSNLSEYSQFAKDIMIDRYWTNDTKYGVKIYLWIDNNRKCLTSDRLANPVVKEAYSTWKTKMKSAS